MFNRLYKRNSNGKIQFWEIRVEPQDNGYIILIDRGQDGGKVVNEKSRFVKEGKNIGRANETSAEQQALMEAESKWNQKKDEGYVEKIDNALQQTVILPMLANKWEKQKKHISFPCYIQPKLDGARCISNGTALISRQGKEFFFLDHILNEIKSLNNPETFYLDGELYSDELTFQQIMSAIKNQKETSVDWDAIKKIKYHVYDCFDLEDIYMPYSKRLDILNNMINNFSNIVPVKTFNVSNEQEVLDFHAKFVDEGWEGAIVRDRKLTYELDKRSNKLLKVKAFQDDEFLIVDVQEAERDAGTAIFVCKDNNTDRTFNCRPKGTRELRSKYLTNKHNYIGKKLTVEFFELTDEGLPRFPVGKAIREDF